MKKIGVNKLFALILMLAVTFSSYGNVSQAASKKYVKSLKLSRSTVSLKAGENIKIKATVKVSGKAKKTVSAKSSDSSVVKVKVGKANKKGVTGLTITAGKAGDAKIMVTAKDKAKNKKAVKKTISVKIAPATTQTTVTTEKSVTTQAPTTTEKPVSTENPSTTEPSATENPASVQVKWTVHTIH